MGDPAGDQEPAGVLARRRALRARLSRSFLILHGLEGSGPEHWQTWLAEQLREQGERVRYPDLPEPFDPDPEEWLGALDRELPLMDGERVVVCHSLACLLWLRHARDAHSRSADRVLLVSPPCTEAVAPVVRFRVDGVTPEHVRRTAGATRMLCSDADPYCPDGPPHVFGEPLELDYEVIPGGGHLNPDAGYGPWPAVEAWALGR